MELLRLQEIHVGNNNWNHLQIVMHLLIASILRKWKNIQKFLALISFLLQFFVN